jgi:hypothetical protein
MSILSSNSQDLSPRRGSSAARGALSGLVPLGLLALIIVIALALAALARQLLAASGFFVQQQAAVIILAAGLVLAVVVYGIACVLIMRLVVSWQQNGKAVRARAALWSLGITALIVILPLLLAVLFPQHPAP